MPMSGVIREILESEGGSMSGEEDFFSVARTIPLVAGRSLVSLGTQGGVLMMMGELFCWISPLMPRAVTPWLTAFRAYSR
jgi:hypothetical protein